MDEVPEDRCGKQMEINVRNTLRVDRYCCFRPVWRDTGECIWHADVEEKPAKELRNRKLPRGERLDEAIFKAVSCPHIDFSNSTLIQTEIRNSTIRGNLEDCILHDAEISNSDLSDSYFKGVDLTDASISDSLFLNCNFSNTYISLTGFLDSTFMGSEFDNARITDPEFEGNDFRGVSFNNSTLSRVDFSRSNLVETNFDNSFSIGLSFEGSVVCDSSFRNSTLRSADFQDSELRNVDFTDANTRNATFDDANLEDATFDGTELRDANLRDTRLYQTLFSDVRINSNTDFGEKSAYEDPNTNLDENYEDTSNWEAAAWVYRRLQNLHEENAMSERARDYHIAKEEAHRAEYREKDEYFQWGVYTLNRYLTKHGESLKHVVAWSIGIILACGLLYPFTGGLVTANGTEQVTAVSDLSLGLFARSFYYSMVTFTTLGYGNPAGTGAKLLVGLESLAGTLLIALFVFVLGRRVAR